ncbi:MAG: hypothetical protein QOJ64_2404 [Acidobacteriota bacterium]|jgi:2-keto-4-pentenoate hydratase/2-oxohepta-3-ene-1,7-dioic acid hydratase in catechol pathway|nr:hypothetical protein [Acidobacteriota bacterium]
MKLCRYTSKGSPEVRYGVIEGDVISPVEGDGSFEGVIATTSERLPIAEVAILPPVAPSKIVCVGRNYKDHAAELGNPVPTEPLLFLKAPSSIIGPNASIMLPVQSAQVEHEGELGIVIGKRASRLGQSEDPLSFVLGYTCVNDVTARDLQRRDVQFTRAKSFDTFCPVGPYISTNVNPENLTVTTRVNGQTRQMASTAAMAFSIPYLLHYISHAMTLYPGDLIATGTPAGVSKLHDGDIVEVEIDEVGILRNPVTVLSADG